jgi:hypothetical protein
MKFVIVVIVSKLTAVAFIVCGIYCLQNGFIKTGGWLVAAGVFYQYLVQIYTLIINP